MSRPSRAPRSGRARRAGRTVPTSTPARSSSPARRRRCRRHGPRRRTGRPAGHLVAARRIDVVDLGGERITQATSVGDVCNGPGSRPGTSVPSASARPRRSPGLDDRCGQCIDLGERYTRRTRPGGGRDTEPLHAAARRSDALPGSRRPRRRGSGPGRGHGYRRPRTTPRRRGGRRWPADDAHAVDAGEQVQRTFGQ